MVSLQSKTKTKTDKKRKRNKSKTKTRHRTTAISTENKKNLNFFIKPQHPLKKNGEPLPRSHKQQLCHQRKIKNDYERCLDLKHMVTAASGFPKTPKLTLKPFPFFPSKKSFGK